MIPEYGSSFPHASAHGAALAARTHRPEADPAPYRNPQSLVARINAYGHDADVMMLHDTKRRAG